MNKALRYAVTFVLAGLVLLLGAPAASADEKPIKLEVVGDGDHNVNVLVTWKKDGNPVTDVVAATLVATATDGRTFGPVQLMSAPEGQNLYNAAEPLPTGEWKVTVTATKPAKATKTANVVAQDVATAPEAAPGPSGDTTGSTSGLDRAAATDATVESESPIDLLFVAGGIAFAVGIVLVAWVGLVSRNRREAGR
ncbi:hypothetical protein [Acrocarpospora catenulata]|uniref:hypothetical protein n=1 Tax=Acrocarpospora catenulata TaxID=2836182 RepID=UPI001BDB122C|nr:hypothetical protein [Acrocarpospora catenulata]